MSKNDDELNEFIDEVTDGAYNLPCVEVILYDRITGDSKERNTVLPPVRQLNVSDLLRTDLTKVYY